MRATLPYIKQQFDRYNELCFDGSLPAITLVIGRAATTMGQFVHPVGRRGTYVAAYDLCKIRISNHYDLAPAELDDILIHEMIHYYIWHNKLHDTSPHGPLFRSMMNRINTLHSRHITISHKVSGQQRLLNAKSRPNYLCVTHWNDGRIGLSVMASTRIFDIYRQVMSAPDVREVEWYWSSHPWFSRFHRCMTFKAYLIRREDYDTYIKSESHRCRCDGTSFRAI